MTMCEVKGVIHWDEPTKNIHSSFLMCVQSHRYYNQNIATAGSCFQ